MNSFPTIPLFKPGRLVAVLGSLNKKRFSCKMVCYDKRANCMPNLIQSQPWIAQACAFLSPELGILCAIAIVSTTIVHRAYTTPQRN